MYAQFEERAALQEQRQCSAQVERRVNTDDTGHFVIDAGLPATGVILEIDGYTESGSGVDKFEYVSDELTLLDKEVMDLGTLQFSLKEAGVTIEP